MSEKNGQEGTMLRIWCTRRNSPLQGGYQFANTLVWSLAHSEAKERMNTWWIDSLLAEFPVKIDREEGNRQDSRVGHMEAEEGNGQNKEHSRGPNIGTGYETPVQSLLIR